MKNRKQFTLEIDQKLFFCYLDLKPRKNLNITIKADNKLYISKPAEYSFDSLKDYLLSNKEWLIKKSNAVNIVSNKRNNYINEDYVIIFGEKIFFAENENILAEIDTILINHINEYRKKLDGIIKVTPTIEVVSMRGKWGLCIPREKLIKINNKLIHYPIDFLNYVLVHEYAHLLVANHSKRFYDLVESIMPDYKIFENYLKYNWLSI